MQTLDIAKNALRYVTLTEKGEVKIEGDAEHQVSGVGKLCTTQDVTQATPEHRWQPPVFVECDDLEGEMCTGNFWSVVARAAASGLQPDDCCPQLGKVKFSEKMGTRCLRALSEQRGMDSRHIL